MLIGLSIILLVLSCRKGSRCKLLPPSVRKWRDWTTTEHTSTCDTLNRITSDGKAKSGGSGGLVDLNEFITKALFGEMTGKAVALPVIFISITLNLPSLLFVHCPSVAIGWNLKTVLT